MKAIITDLDRTLLRTDKSLSEYTVDVFNRCRKNGIAILAATARPERSIVSYCEQIHFDAVVTMNGARILLPDKVLENSISHLSGKSILSKLMTVPEVVISIETSDGLYSNVDIPEWTPVVYDGFPNLPTQGRLYKILASSTHDVIFQRIEEAVTDDTYHTIANNNLIQVMGKKATKWNGIQEMLKVLNISQEETVYFGDDNDDIEPIKMCGMGVAVSNAIEAVLKEADYVTDSNDEDGVARFVEKRFL